MNHPEQRCSRGGHVVREDSVYPIYVKATLTEKPRAEPLEQGTDNFDPIIAEHKNECETCGHHLWEDSSCRPAGLGTAAWAKRALFRAEDKMSSQ
jgi:hypothetical protein